MDTKFGPSTTSAFSFIYAEGLNQVLKALSATQPHYKSARNLCQYLIYSLLLFLFLPVSVGYTLTKEDKHFIDSWNDSAKYMCSNLFSGEYSISQQPELNGRALITVGYTYRVNDDIISCLYADKLDAARYLFVVINSDGIIITQLLSEGSRAQLFDKKASNKYAAINQERGKAACKVAEKKKQRLPDRLWILGAINKGTIHTLREKHNIVPGEAEYLCEQYLQERNR